jgi:hypothetical protein
MDYGDFECAGRMMTDVWRSKFLAGTTGQSDPFQLMIGDGNVVELSLREGLDFIGRLYDECAESSGSWHGTSGDLDGRTGTFTLVGDSVQTVLHLVED